MATYYVGGIPYSDDDIRHYGRKGMKWGQNVFTTWAEYMQGLGKKVGGAANQAKNTVSNAATQARNTASNVYSQARNAAGNAYNQAREYVTGNQAKQNLSKAQSDYNKRVRGTGWIPITAKKATNNLNNAQSAYNRTLPGQMENLRKNAGQALNNARQSVTNAYAEAAKKAGGAGKNIEQFYNEVMKNAKNQINAGKQLVSAYGSKAVNSIQAAGDKALAGPKSWLDGMLNKFRKNKTPAVKDRETLPGSSSGGNTHEMLRSRRNVYSRDTKDWNKSERKRGSNNFDSLEPGYAGARTRSVRDRADIDKKKRKVGNNAR